MCVPCTPQLAELWEKGSPHLAQAVFARRPQPMAQALAAGKAGLAELWEPPGLCAPAQHALAELLGFVDWNSMK